MGSSGLICETEDKKRGVILTQTKEHQELPEAG